MLDINKMPIFPFQVETVQHLLLPSVAKLLTTLPHATGIIDFVAIPSGLLPSGDYFFCNVEGEYQFLTTKDEEVPVILEIEVMTDGTRKNKRYVVNIPFSTLLTCGGSKSTFPEFFSETAHEQVQELFLEVIIRKAHLEMKNLAN